ncbi:hypothetical protein [Tissierella praeacuta]|uniref:hypothetical protein n=1 Tax=Tissierella praeacuta TaxID=43131 RepID=UPI002FD93216
MAYNERSILTDLNRKPIPQYFNTEKNTYEVQKGSGGASYAKLVDGSGNTVDLTNKVNQIIVVLNNLVEVVKDGV